MPPTKRHGSQVEALVADAPLSGTLKELNVELDRVRGVMQELLRLQLNRAGPALHAQAGLERRRHERKRSP